VRYLSVVLAGLMASPLAAQDTGLKLNLVVVEGEGAINNIKQRTAREPVIQVEDQNHRPIAGAAVVFTLPSQGASGTFAGASHSLTVMSDSQGRAIAHGLRPNNVQGQYQIHVNASYNGQTTSTNISQTNAIVAGAAAGAAAGGISAKLLIVLAVAAGAAAGGAIYATHNGGGNNGSAAINPGVSISPGAGTVGPPR